MREYEQRNENDVIGLAPKTLLLDLQVIDSVGNAINASCSAFNIGIGQVDCGQFDKPMRVFAFASQLPLS